nr:MAG TPA: hypothetical protein [Crassvirales sp.]
MNGDTSLLFDRIEYPRHILNDKGILINLVFVRHGKGAYTFSLLTIAFNASNSILNIAHYSVIKILEIRAVNDTIIRASVKKEIDFLAALVECDYRKFSQVNTVLERHGIRMNIKEFVDYFFEHSDDFLINE